MNTSRRPSLRRRLLFFLLISMASLLVVAAWVIYSVALAYANRVHDHDLSDEVVTLAAMVGTENFDGELSAQARYLLENDPDGRNYFSIRSRKHGLLAGSGSLQPYSASVGPAAAPILYDTLLGQQPLRAAASYAISRFDPDDALTVVVAEPMRDRTMQARDILLMAVLMQALTLPITLALVAFGVNYGLRALDPLTARLAARTHELTPIGGNDVPHEILPLTRTIDALFSRLRSALTLQDRFIADAAHQLRTPLAGLSLHVERALADPRPQTVADALEHIHRLTQRAARTASQLLALTRAQATPGDVVDNSPVDLAKIVPEAVSQRVHEAIAADVDLGYEGPDRPLYVQGDTASLLDLLDNLIDNSVRYAGHGSTVTVRLHGRVDGGVNLSVEDDGPGVPPDLLPRLSERFFRVPGNNADGSGLGLSIVQHIAEHHHAEVIYRLGEKGGLTVEVRFPAALRST